MPNCVSEGVDDLRNRINALTAVVFRRPTICLRASSDPAGAKSWSCSESSGRDSGGGISHDDHANLAVRQRAREGLDNYPQQPRTIIGHS